MLNDYKYGDPIFTHHHPKDMNKDLAQILFLENTNCTIKILDIFENEFKIKYVINDKSLGPGIVDEKVYNQIASDQTNKILTQIDYKHNPAIIRDIAIELVYKYKHILHDKNHIPNQSLIDILNDLHQAKNGYFKWNPLYKAHKMDGNDNHTHKLRPVLSSNDSPLKPILKLIAHVK